MPDAGSDFARGGPEEAAVLTAYVYSTLSEAGRAAAAEGLSGPLLKGVLLGLGAAVPIGPVNVEMARRALRGGFFAGFALGCGAVTVDVLYLVLSSLSVAQLLNHPRVLKPLAVAGVGLPTCLR